MGARTLSIIIRESVLFELIINFMEKEVQTNGDFGSQSASTKEWRRMNVQPANRASTRHLILVEHRTIYRDERLPIRTRLRPTVRFPSIPQ